jgi:hypothetical protein
VIYFYVPQLPMLFSEAKTLSKMHFSPNDLFLADKLEQQQQRRCYLWLLNFNKGKKIHFSFFLFNTHKEKDFLLSQGEEEEKSGNAITSSSG